MLEINNYYEQLVTEQLMKMAKHVEELTHKEIMEDVACLALNNLPSRYVRSLVDLHSHFTYQDVDHMEKEVTEAINRALERVKRHSHLHR